MCRRFTILTILWVAAFGIQGQVPSVLSTGVWYKFSVVSDGVYKIDYDALQKAGFSPAQINPANIRLFAADHGMLPQSNAAPRQNALIEIAITVTGQSDGKFDTGDEILFWGEGPDSESYNTTRKIFNHQKNIYSDKNYYYLTVGSQAGKRMGQAADVAGSNPIITTYDDLGYYETDQYNILKSGREWFGEQFDSKTDITVRFNTPGITAGSSIKFVSSVMAQSYTGNSSFNISFNDVSIGSQTIPPIPNAQYTAKGAVAQDTLILSADAVSAPGRTSQDIRYQYAKAAGTSIGYLNNFQITFTRDLKFYGSPTFFQAAQSLANPASQYRVDAFPSNGVIWDVTNSFAPKIQAFTPEQNIASFSSPGDSLRRYVIFTDDKVPVAVRESAVSNQNLAGLSCPDMLIITHPNFRKDADRLAAHRQSFNHISVTVVNVDQIYNEYSSGKLDVTAIRDFVHDIASRTGSGLDNLLLIGRGSYDYKNRVLGNTNFIPAYESRNSLDPLATYSSDDYYTFLEAGEGEWPEDPAVNSSMDIGVGRIPVTATQQLSDVVDKIIEYETSPKGFGPWRQQIVFTADDGDTNIHQSQADQLATSIDTNHPEEITKKIYLDAFKQVTLPTGQFSPQAHEALERAVDHGAVIVNYTGHGSEEVWMQERVLDPDLIKKWQNGPRYPLFVNATCEFGRQDDPFQISSGENLLFRKAGGAIALVSTARPVNSGTNFELNKSFYSALFQTSNGQYRELGAIFRDTKNNSQSGVSNRNFSLIGDPYLHLAFPQNQVVITQSRTLTNSDTLKALSDVVITGEIRRGGVKRNDFNGDVDVTVLDRPVAVTTLGDENAPFRYNDWSNAVFRGKASVNNGSFTLRFTMPIDLEDLVANGKIAAYAQNGIENASGSKVIPMGGDEPDAPSDATAPDMMLYIGDTTFVNGGVAGPNTTLIAHLHDTHGISLSGNNDIVATLDDSLKYVVNEYYSASKDDFTKGTVSFPIYDLQKGSHHIVVEASDTYGNRSSSRIEFIVPEEGIVISEFYNYPNPFSSLTQSTILGFTHNRPGESLEAVLVIYDLAGNLVDTQQYTIAESFSHVTLAEWTGVNGNGNKLSNGIYLGKLSVRSLLDGSKNEQITKLIILN